MYLKIKIKIIIEVSPNLKYIMIIYANFSNLPRMKKKYELHFINILCNIVLYQTVS